MNKMIQRLLIIIILLCSIVSCSYNENDAKKIVESFLTDLKYENANNNDAYPSYSLFDRHKKINDFKIDRIQKEGKNNFAAYCQIEVNPQYINIYEWRNVIFYLSTSADNKLYIKDSKGLSFYDNEKISLCSKLGLIKGNTDVNIGKEYYKCSIQIETYKKLVLDIINVKKNVSLKGIVKKTGSFGLYDFISLTIVNNSPVYLSGNDYVASVIFYDSHGYQLKKIALNNFSHNLNVGEKITINKNTENYLELVDVPDNYSKYAFEFDLVTNNIVNIISTNSHLFNTYI
jgi:hypothetical protein